MRVAICISTFHRPEGLDALLRSLALLDPDEDGPQITVVVVNNDPDDPRPASSIDRLAEAYPHRLVCLAEPERGVSPPRNRALDFALADHDFIAFIDDDSVATPRWLASLLEVQRATHADVVTGPVAPAHEAPPPTWVETGRFFAPRMLPTGRHVSHAFTNNALVSARLLRETGLRFDTRLSATGGEDTHFFRRLRLLGAAIVWSGEAVVEDSIPAERATAAWLIRRHLRTGMNTSWIERDLRPAVVVWPATCARSITWMVLGAALFAGGVLMGQATRVRARCWLAWSRGLILGLVASIPPEYIRR